MDDYLWQFENPMKFAKWHYYRWLRSGYHGARLDYERMIVWLNIRRNNILDAMERREHGPQLPRTTGAPE